MVSLTDYNKEINFIQLNADPSAQNLSPKKMECYCKFVENHIETIPVLSSLNTKGEVTEPKFYETTAEVSSAKKRANNFANALRNAPLG